MPEIPITLGLAYLSVLNTGSGGDLVQELRQRFDGKLIVNNRPSGAQTPPREQALLFYGLDAEGYTDYPSLEAA